MEITWLIPPLEVRIILSSILMLLAIVCFVLSKRQPLSRKEREELEELNRILLEQYRPKDCNTNSKTDLKKL